MLELAAGLLSLSLFIRYGLTYQYFLYLLFTCGLFVISLIDLRHKIIPFLNQHIINIRIPFLNPFDQFLNKFFFWNLRKIQTTKPKASIRNTQPYVLSPAMREKSPATTRTQMMAAIRSHMVLSIFMFQPRTLQGNPNIWCHLPGRHHSD